MPTYNEFNVFNFDEIKNIDIINKSLIQKKIVSVLILAEQDFELEFHSINKKVVKINSVTPEQNRIFLRVSKKVINRFIDFKVNVDMCEDYKKTDSGDGKDNKPYIEEPIQYTFSGYNPVTGQFSMWTSSFLTSKRPDGEAQDYLHVCLVTE